MAPPSLENRSDRIRLLRRVLRRVDDEEWTIQIKYLEDREAESNPETLEIVVCPHREMLRSLIHEVIHAAEVDKGLSEEEIEEIAALIVADLSPIQVQMLFRKYFGGTTL